VHRVQPDDLPGRRAGAADRAEHARHVPGAGLDQPAVGAALGAVRDQHADGPRSAGSTQPVLRPRATNGDERKDGRPRVPRPAFFPWALSIEAGRIGRVSICRTEAPFALQAGNLTPLLQPSWVYRRSIATPWTGVEPRLGLGESRAEREEPEPLD